MGNPVQTNLYLLAEMADVLDREEQTFGTKKRVVNAAIWLFDKAEAATKIKAIQAVAAMERGPMGSPLVAPNYRPQDQQAADAVVDKALADEKLIARKKIRKRGA